MTSTIVTRARVEGLVIVAVAAGYLWQAHQIPDMYQMPGVPGPTAFPTLIGIIFGLAGVWRMFAPTATVDSEQPWAEDEGVAEDAAVTRGGFPGWLKAHGRFYGMWAVLLGYLLLMPIVGFPVTTAIGLAALVALLGENRWPRVVLVAVITTVVLWFLFGWGLGVHLPRGVLAPFLSRT